MLFVFDREMSLDEEAAVLKQDAGEVITYNDDKVLDSGITPPTAHVVQRRFMRTRRYIEKFDKAMIHRAEAVLESIEADKRDIEIVRTLPLT